MRVGVGVGDTLPLNCDAKGLAMAGYWIVRASEVKDQEAQRSYGSAWAPLAERYGAKVIAGPGRLVTKEGDPRSACFHRSV
jgi:uncharacterized protein (DUF1330 family)